MKQNAKPTSDDLRLATRLALVAALGAVLFLSPVMITVTGRFLAALGLFAAWLLIIGLVMVIVRRTG